MYHFVVIPYLIFYLTYFHIWNNDLFLPSILVAYFYIDVVFMLPNQLEGDCQIYTDRHFFCNFVMIFCNMSYNSIQISYLLALDVAQTYIINNIHSNWVVYHQRDVKMLRQIIHCHLLYYSERPVVIEVLVNFMQKESSRPVLLVPSTPVFSPRIATNLSGPRWVAS